MAAVVDEFAGLAKNFNFTDFVQVLDVKQSLEEYGVTNDLALRKALQEAGLPVVATSGIKRRHQDQAFHEAALCVIDGYQVTRFILGTWRKPVKYTLHTSEIDANKKRLLDRGQTYSWDDLMLALTGPGIEAFQGMTSVTNTFLDKVLGHRKGQAVRLAAMLDGMRLALAEEELFCLRSQVTN